MNQSSATPQISPAIERVQQIEREVQERMRGIDENIEHLREGGFIKSIIRREITHFVQKEEEEKKRVQEEEKRQQDEKEAIRLEEIRRSKRNRMGCLLGAGILTAAAAFGVKEYVLPRVPMEDVKKFVENIKRATAPINETHESSNELPPVLGQKKVWVSPEEEAHILDQREKKEDLRIATEELIRARLQLQGWTEEPETNAQKEASMIHWNRRVEELEHHVREIHASIVIGDRHELQPAPDMTTEQAQLPQEETEEKP